MVSVAFCSEFAFSRDVWKKAGFCFEKHTFLSWKSKIWTFLDFLLTQWLSSANFYVEILAVLKKFKSLFQKTQPFFLKKPIFKAIKKFIISVAFCSKIATFNDFLKCAIFSENHLIYFLTKATFRTFLKFFSCRRILRQIGTFWRLWIIWVIFLEEPVPTLKKGNIGTLWTILLSQSLLRQNFLRLTSSRFKLFY